MPQGKDIKLPNEDPVFLLMAELRKKDPRLVAIPDEALKAALAKQVDFSKLPRPTPPPAQTPLPPNDRFDRAGFAGKLDPGTRPIPGFGTFEGAGAPDNPATPVVDAIAGPNSRRMVGGALGAMLPTMIPGFGQLPRAAQYLAPVAGAMFGGATGDASRQFAQPNAPGVNPLSTMAEGALQQGNAQMLFGALPNAAAQEFLLPLMGRGAVGLNSRALRPYADKQEFDKIRNALGNPKLTDNEVMRSMGHNELEQGYGRVGSNRAAKAANASNEATVAAKDRTLQGLSQQGVTVDPRQALSGIRGLQDEAGSSFTNYQPNQDSIHNAVKSYMEHPDLSFQVNATKPMTVQLPMGGGGTQSFKIPGQTQPYSYTQMKTGVDPQDMTSMLRRTGYEFGPKFTANTPLTAGQEATEQMYGKMSDAVGALDPTISQANNQLTQNIPLSNALNNATMGGRGIAERAGMTSRLRPYLNATMSGGEGWLAQKLFGLSNLQPSTAAQTWPNALRGVSFGFGQNNDR